MAPAFILLFVVTFVFLAHQSAAAQGDAREVYHISNACGRVHDCWNGELYQSFDHVLRNFLYKDVQPNIDYWCASRQDCWVEECGDQFLKTDVTINNKILDWVCQRGYEFGQAADCFRYPFTQRMTDCGQSYNYFTFENCVADVVRFLPCAEEGKALTRDLITFIMDLRKTLGSI